MTDHGLGRIPHVETPLAMAAYPVTERAGYKVSTRTHRYWFEGEAIDAAGDWTLDQGQDGTCVGNAFAHRYADGPVTHSGIDEDWARQLYLDASGDTTYQKGTSGLAACRILKSRGEISAYHWIDSADELRNTVLELGSVQVGCDWMNSMFDPTFEFSNAYLNVDFSKGLAGGHEFDVNGINLKPTEGPAFYRIHNSWGPGWGHHGTARIACAVLENLIFNRDGDAVSVTEVP